MYDKGKVPQAANQSIKIKYDIVKLSLKQAMPTRTSTIVTDLKYSSIIWGGKKVVNRQLKLQTMHFTQLKTALISFTHSINISQIMPHHRSCSNGCNRAMNTVSKTQSAETTF